MRSLKWTAPALLATAALMLSACSGGGTTPSAGPGMGAPLGASHVGKDLHVTAQVMHANKPCPPNDNLGCFSDSLTSGLVIGWCLGTSSDPCGQTNTVSWSGDIQLNKTGHPVGKSKLSAAFSGPFACTPSTCSVSGPNDTYELDTFTNGKKLAKVKGYKYAQQICLNSSCPGYYIGINVGP